MTSRATRTPYGDLVLEVSRCSEQCHRAYNAALDVGHADLCRALRDMGQELAGLLRRLAEEQAAVLA